MSTARAATLLGPERLEIRKYPLPEVADAEDVVEAVADETGGAMADVVVDVSGSPAALASSVAAVRKRGTLVLAGLVGTGREVPLEIDSLVWKEIRVLDGLVDSVRRLYGDDMAEPERWARRLCPGLRHGKPTLDGQPK